MTFPPLDGWLAVCGLKREAQIWGGRAVVGGGRSDLLAERLEAAIAAAPPTALISFGVCGALADGLRVGDLLSGRSVVDEAGGRWLCDPALHARILSRTRAGSADFAGYDRVVTDPSEKAALARASAAVDMESHVAARAAAAHGLPLLVLRCVSDASDHRLPPAATAGMAPDGSVNGLAVLRSLLCDPRQLPYLMRLGRNSTLAFDRLTKARRQLSPSAGS